MLRKLYILYGGPSSEHGVSFGTRDFFLDLYKDRNPICIKWRKDFLFEIDKDIYEEVALLSFLVKSDSIVIIASHGEFVEDGYIQEKFEKKGIFFTGSDSSSCKLAQDKYKSMCAVRGVVDVPLTYKAKPASFSFSRMKKILGDTFPVFVKPLDLGSSVDVHKVATKQELLSLVPKLTYKEYLFQESLEGMEVSLGSVRRDTGFMKLFPTEIIPSTEFFDYTAKYVPGVSKEITPARISTQLTKELQNVTNKIHNILGLGYYSRSDFIITKNSDIYYLETNALPGMTKTSLVPQQLRHAKKMSLFKETFLENLC